MPSTQIFSALVAAASGYAYAHAAVSTAQNYNVSNPRPATPNIGLQNRMKKSVKSQSIRPRHGENTKVRSASPHEVPKTVPAALPEVPKNVPADDLLLDDESLPSSLCSSVIPRQPPKRQTRVRQSNDEHINPDNLDQQIVTPPTILYSHACTTETTSDKHPHDHHPILMWVTVITLSALSGAFIAWCLARKSCVHETNINFPSHDKAGGRKEVADSLIKKSKQVAKSSPAETALKPIHEREQVVRLTEADFLLSSSPSMAERQKMTVLPKQSKQSDESPVVEIQIQMGK